ncbi:MAG: pilus assembly protein N-terminal domain-containing protein [Micropepsaceae bacterium]
MSAFRAALLAAVTASFALPAFADGTQASLPGHMRVDYEKTTVVKLDRSAKTVLVGNPLIADALLVNDKTVYVQGRMFGNTNIIAVDSQGTEVLNTNVTVGAPNLAQVTIYRGSMGQRNLACSPRCERTVTQGDKEMDLMHADSDKKVDVSRKSADLATDRR